MNVNRIKHQRYLTMAETISDYGGVILLSARGKILNVMPRHHLGDLIPHDMDLRGCVVYLDSTPTCNEDDWLIDKGIKEIYYTSEDNEVWKLSGTRFEGINYAEDIAKLQDEIGQ